MAEDWTDLPPTPNLAEFAVELPAILEETQHHEIYGVELQAVGEGKPPAHTTLIILSKFLRANADDPLKAKEQLSEASKWRKTYRPLDALKETFSADKFGRLGYVTTINGAKETKSDKDVVTFNIYGAAAKDPKKSNCTSNEATKPIPDYGQGPDPYEAVQVHDYLSVSFFRQPAEVKASSSKIIDLFQRYYPETVSYKYFVNVPLVMQWMMGTMKALMSKETVQKMTWMTYGSSLQQYLGDGVPEEYGGIGPPLSESAMTVV
ncbi:hypothetical protein B0A55_10186 [Friedmanniomyces simplex]|uniref:Phosphatidylinositol transfer protein SFH5 n=1 Tax=Friedmanniomyces simplex TaxID=329884 RepID=A0A4U0WJ51_9PEZI|nr:hypothetical protein B0A55_10186 [Friedmanniomyces simplex]